ncbi:MAG: type II secretion system F family protein [Candidatus Eremiobacterota bacterium]
MNLQRRSVPPKVLASGLGHLAFLFRAGIQISVALDTLTRQQDHPVLGQAWEDVRGLIESGHKLSDAFGRHPHVFPPMVVMMVRAGEETGDLGGRLQRAADLLQRRAHYESKVRQALSTPALTALVSGVVLIGLVKVVVPRFTEMYAALNVQLPLLTRAATGVVQVLNHPSFPAALLVIAALGITYQAQIRTFVFHLLLWLPWTRDLMASLLSVEFCDMLASLYTSGVPLNRALSLLAGASEQESYRAMLTQVRQKVEMGGTLSQVVRDEIPFFPRVVSGMLEVGVSTGRLDVALTSVQRVLDLDVEARLQTLQVSLEPVLMAVLGAVLTAFFMALMLPMYDMIARLGF